MMYTGDEHYDALQQIRAWQENNTLTDFIEAISKRVIGQSELASFLGVVYSYIMCLANGTRINSNVLLSAPSGCGKTETYRAIREYFADEAPDFVVSINDTSQITATGYRGMDACSIVDKFMLQASEAPIGLCFMDEFDKAIYPSVSSTGEDNHKELQANLLMIIGGGIASNTKLDCSIDTSRIMFVGLGAFDRIRDARKDKVESKSIGFAKETQSTNELLLYQGISRDDMLRSGGIGELVGRFPFIINYQPLDTSAIEVIINRILQDVGQTFRATITINPELRNYLHEQSSSRYGIRLLDSIVRELALKQFVMASKECGGKMDKLVIKLGLNEGSYAYKKVEVQKSNVNNQICLQIRQ